MNDVNTIPTSAVAYKRKAAWDGIRLEHCQLRPGELPAHTHREHVVLLSLSDGCKGELITSSGIGIRGTQTRGNICVLPSGLQHQVALENSSENLALYVDRGPREKIRSVTACITLCTALVIGVAARKGKRSARISAQVDALENRGGLYLNDNTTSSYGLDRAKKRA